MTKDKMPSGIEVSVEEGERVRLSFPAEGNVFYFTPEEARALASQLIQTVYQAEVRHSLKRDGAKHLAPTGRRVVEAPFPVSRIAPAKQ